MFYLLLTNSTGEFIDLVPELADAHTRADEELENWIGEKIDILIYEVDPVTLKKKFICSVSQ